nr:LOW QUALITY PROTEIN: pseudouridylate synthase 7 homolog [Rhipicephalus microplus]
MSADNENDSSSKKRRVGFEEEVGITEFVGEHKGFNGVLKQRYSDFLVNEIDPSGCVVRLETLEPPPEPKPDTSWADDNVSTEAKEHLELLADGQRTEPVVIPVAGLSKEQRGQVHVWIRAHWPHLESHTATDSTVRVSRSKVQRRRAAPWPSGRPSYTTFVLYKENMDTIEAVNRIATFLGMRPSCLGYAGTKDKRAKTCQRVSCHRLPAKKLLSLNRRQGLWVGNITFENAAIKLGDLQGNRFTIVLRDIDGTKADHEEAMKSLSKNGFLNYYGTQRFGTTSVATHQIGRALLKGCYEEAVDLVLQPRDGGALAECREEWARSKDAAQALAKLPHRGCIEGLLLRALTKGGATNYLGALLALPRNVRLLYLHGYQSYVWNRLVSRRVQRFGLTVLPGDLLMTPGLGAEDSRSRRLWNLTSVQMLVLPLPGHSVRYPQNEIADWYKEILAEDGLTLNSFSEQKHRDLSMSGCYRHLVAVPRDVQWQEVSYTDPQAALVLSDLDKLQGLPEPPSCESDENARRALKLEFNLSSSCYATMAVRELLHRECTSWTPIATS